MTYIKVSEKISPSIPKVASDTRKRYAICGLSKRALTTYILPLLHGEYTSYGEIVGLVDIDQKRLQAFNDIHNTQIRTYLPEEFDRMIYEVHPDRIIIASPDVTHADYIVKALLHNCNVLVEKPMVINCQQADNVIEAVKNSQGNLQVNFNFRYRPAHIQIKRMIQEDLIGRVTNVEFVYNLDTAHGSSYFRRWNRDRAQSGGLSVTKGCHHFDLVNWWLDDLPQQVFAYGALNYYGVNSPYNPSRSQGKHFSIEEQKEKCPYFQRWSATDALISDQSLSPLERQIVEVSHNTSYPDYQQAYIYDEDITIEDTYSAVVQYHKGASMTYSTNFSAPWEGYILGINGTKGRIESVYYASPSRCPFPANQRQTITYYPLFGERQIHDTHYIEGKHGGADAMLKYEIFVGRLPGAWGVDLAANYIAGLYAVAVGEAIWRSIEEKCPITIQDLLTGI